MTISSSALYELRQSWKPLFLEIAGHALRKALLYALAFAAVFLAAAYDYRWFAELAAWMTQQMPGTAAFSTSFSVMYVLGGVPFAIYIGITNGIADKTDRIGELIRQTGRPLLESLAQDARATNGISIDALRRFIQTGDATALAGSLGPLRQLGAALRSRPFRLLRKFLENILKEFEMRGASEVTMLQFLQAALPKLPDFVTTQVIARWRISRYIAWTFAALWFALPIVLTHLLPPN